jgi:hypothetical protein
LEKIEVEKERVEMQIEIKKVWLRLKYRAWVWVLLMAGILTFHFVLCCIGKKKGGCVSTYSDGTGQESNKHEAYYETLVGVTSINPS